MMPEENGPAVPEFARRVTASSCRDYPVRALVPVLTAMPAAAIPLGDVLADSGYAHRDPSAWALPLRQAGRSPGPAVGVRVDVQSRVRVNVQRLLGVSAGAAV